ncbi:MAG: sugar ABC transporter permease [candidate division WOR-3 bacterium]|nr:sugar ABC transporter permease [candidate division WOR-3 bacterium]
MKKQLVRRRKRKSKHALIGYLFLSPAFLFYAIFLVFPVGFSIYLSFHRWNMLTPPLKARYVGIKHFTYLLMQDETFLIVLKNTLFYALGTVFIGMILALILALVLSKVKYSTIWRFVYFVPVVTPPVAIGMIWGYLYRPTDGLINTVLRWLYLPGQQWLSSPAQALPSIMITGIWAGIGFTMLIFVAGLKSIPEMYYDVARIDGANSWQRFWHITFPLLKPTILFVLVTGMIGAWQVFALVFMMSSGGIDTGVVPFESVGVVALYMYQTVFRAMRMGRASAMAFILFLVVLFITLIELRVLRRGGVESY